METKRRVVNRPEQQLQKAIKQYLDYAAPPLFAFHPANGGKRNFKEAVQFKSMGVVAGVPDFVICAPEGKVYFIELKIGKNDLSDEQVKVLAKLANLGFNYSVCRS